MYAQMYVHYICRYVLCSVPKRNLKKTAKRPKRNLKETLRNPKGNRKETEKKPERDLQKT